MTEHTSAQKTSKIALGIGGGGFYFESICLLKTLSQHYDFIAIIPSDSKILSTPIAEKFPNCTDVYAIPAVTNFSLEKNQFSKIASFFKSLYSSYKIIDKEKPFAIIVLGSSMAIPLFIVAKLKGIKTVFVESITRVNNPSKTSQLIAYFGLANKFYVQWPELLSQVDKSIYKGTIL